MHLVSGHLALLLLASTVTAQNVITDCSPYRNLIRCGLEVSVSILTDEIAGIYLHIGVVAGVHVSLVVHVLTSAQVECSNPKYHNCKDLHMGYCVNGVCRTDVQGLGPKKPPKA
ncbi:hypothetical protein Tdes44962_MAKER05995 [Teratosphaeria destructans]|uniref:Hydrophobin n=1 Tax=Teratosphaeria destructans TaxID=418781 RepID=A0A9W7SIJ3_9PEZI|nr:hypothetical protein Tdes44962_MAKER05995 [Teratosphaeria destructans]